MRIENQFLGAWRSALSIPSKALSVDVPAWLLWNSSFAEFLPLFPIGCMVFVLLSSLRTVLFLFHSANSEPTYILLLERNIRTSPVVQWLRLCCTSNAEGASLIPGQGTKIPHAEHCKQTKFLKRKDYHYHFVISSPSQSVSSTVPCRPSSSLRLLDT